jgi:hypothetical protein
MLKSKILWINIKNSCFSAETVEICLQKQLLQAKVTFHALRANNAI